MDQAPDYFEQNADRIMSVVDGWFATEPMTAVPPAEQRVSEEELHRFFEQAISARVQAISAGLKRVSGPLTHQPHTIGDGEGLAPEGSYLSPRQGSSPFGSVLVLLAGTRGAGMWLSLLSQTWQRGVILVSLALLLLMSGFDLMGLLVLHMC